MTIGHWKTCNEGKHSTKLAMQQYFVGQRFDFPRWLHDMGIPYGDQRRFISLLTGQQEFTVAQWGAQLENMPELFQGFLWGYFQGCATAQAQQQQPPNHGSFQQPVTHDRLLAQLAMMRY
jgi:hypothetical protein